MTQLILDRNLFPPSAKNPEAFKKRFGESIVEKYESDIGLTLEKPHFTVWGLQMYLMYLLAIVRSKQLPNLSKEEQKKYVMGLRDWVRGQEEHCDSGVPLELFRRFDPELAEAAEAEAPRLQKKYGLHFNIEEDRNERPHKKEVQE